MVDRLNSGKTLGETLDFCVVLDMSKVMDYGKTELYQYKPLIPNVPVSSQLGTINLIERTRSDENNILTPIDEFINSDKTIQLYKNGTKYTLVIKELNKLSRSFNFETYDAKPFDIQKLKNTIAEVQCPIEKLLIFLKSDRKIKKP